MLYFDAVSAGGIAVVIAGLVTFAIYFFRRQFALSLTWLFGHTSKRKTTVLDLPPRPKHHVHGRSSLVREIQLLFTKLLHDSPSSVAVVYIEGPPGFGKTQLARLYAEEYSVS